MATVAQAVEAFRIHFNEPAPRSQQIARHLIDDELLPKSYGKRVAHLSAADVATYLLAISTATNKAADAAKCASTWGGMTLTRERRRSASGGPPLDTLLNFMTKTISDVWSENGNGSGTELLLRSTIEITTTTPQAIIDLDTFRLEYLPPGSDPPAGRQRVDRIPGNTLRQIAMALREGAR